MRVCDTTLGSKLITSNPLFFSRRLEEIPDIYDRSYITTRQNKSEQEIQAEKTTLPDMDPYITCCSYEIQKYRSTRQTRAHEEARKTIKHSPGTLRPTAHPPHRVIIAPVLQPLSLFTF